MIRTARSDERGHIVELLARAFADDPLATWLLRSGARRGPALRRYMDVAVRRCAMAGGRMEVTDDLAGAALWGKPGRWRQPWWRELQLAPRMLPGLRPNPNVVRALLAVERAQPRAPHHYLFVIGVDPQRRAEGIGSALLDARLTEIDSRGEAAYLEASSEASARLYARHGFAVTGELRPPGGGPALWPMWRSPRPRLDPAVLELGAPGAMRKRLVQAVLTGEKTATTCLAALHDLVGRPPPAAGQRAVVVDSAGRPVAEVEFTEVERRRLADVDLDIAIAEGEGFTSVADWRGVHEAFWNRYREAIRTELGDPSWEVGDDAIVVVERFRLVSQG